MEDLNKIYLYRMTHINNVPHILVHGITHKDSANANPNFTPIGDSSLISTRSLSVLGNGKALDDYIPFYFGLRMPMLYAIQNGFNGVPIVPAEQIVYCVSSVAGIMESELDCLFTDGHAVDSFSSQYSKSDIERIGEILDMNAIKAKYWKRENDLDLKRRKQAEFLILGDIPTNAILGFLVFNENAKTTLTEMGVAEQQIIINNRAYF